MVRLSITHEPRGQAFQRAPKFHRTPRTKHGLEDKISKNFDMALTER